MKLFFRFFFLTFFLFTGLVITIPVFASPLEDPIEKAKLPNSEWTWDKVDKKNGPAVTMYVKKIGQAVNVRLHTYDVPVAARNFLEQVRLKIMEKPDYAGAEVKLVTSKEIGGKTWDAFSIRRKDEINQEIWARKTDPSVVFMVIYTAAGGFYDQYYNDFLSLLQRSSDWKASGGIGG